MNNFKQSSLSMILGAVLVSSSSLAQAEDMYIGIQGMWTDLDDFSFDVAPGTIDSEFDSGSGFGVTLGRDFGQVRGELEYTMRSNDIESHSLNGSPTLPGSKGEVQTDALMINAYYDFPASGTISPYIGAGIGMASVDVENFGVTPIPNVLNDSDDQLAYQLMAGVSANVSDGWQLFAEYRYFATDDIDVTTSAVTGGVDNSIGYETNNFLVGARFMF